MDPLHVYALSEVLNGRADQNTEKANPERSHVAPVRKSRPSGRNWGFRIHPRHTRPPRLTRRLRTRRLHAPERDRNNDALPPAA